MNGKPAHRSDRETFPTLRERYGHDPARFLDHDLVERGADHTDWTNQALARAVIRGLPSVEVVRAWMAVERQLDRGPRDRVLEWLEQREADLQAHGDRDERLAAVSEREIEPRTAADYEAMPTVTPLPPTYQIWGSPSERLAEKARRRNEA